MNVEGFAAVVVPDSLTREVLTGFVTEAFDCDVETGFAEKLCCVNRLALEGALLVVNGVCFLDVEVERETECDPAEVFVCKRRGGSNIIESGMRVFGANTGFRIVESGRR